MQNSSHIRLTCSATEKFLSTLRACFYFINNSNELWLYCFPNHSRLEIEMERIRRVTVGKHTQRTGRLIGDKNGKTQKHTSRDKDTKNYSQGTVRGEACGPSHQMKPAKQKMNIHDDNPESSKDHHYLRISSKDRVCVTCF